MLLHKWRYVRYWWCYSPPHTRSLYVHTLAQVVSKYRRHDSEGGHSFSHLLKGQCSASFLSLYPHQPASFMTPAGGVVMNECPLSLSIISASHREPSYTRLVVTHALPTNQQSTGLNRRNPRTHRRHPFLYYSAHKKKYRTVCTWHGMACFSWTTCSVLVCSHVPQSYQSTLPDLFCLLPSCLSLKIKPCVNEKRD